MSTIPKKQPQKKWHGPCIYKVREVQSPLHHTFRGFRMVVAVPNMNGHKPFSDTPYPSFTKAYMLFQSSDYNGDVVAEKVEQHIRWLLNRGFTQVEHADQYAERQQEMSKNHTTHVDYDDTDDTEE